MPLFLPIPQLQTCPVNIPYRIDCFILLTGIVDMHESISESAYHEVGLEKQAGYVFRHPLSDHIRPQKISSNYFLLFIKIDNGLDHFRY